MVAFAMLLLLVMLSPILFAKKILPPREEIYSSVSWRFGSYPFLYQQIFHEQGDVDIAFMGASHIWWGVNSPYVQSALSQRIGRPAHVITLGWQWPGFDAVYFIAKDLLQHRRVHMLVICDEQPVRYLRPQALSHRWFRFGDNAPDLAGLSMVDQAAYYSGAILGIPRNLLSLLRTNFPNDLTDAAYLKNQYGASNPIVNLGSLDVCLPFEESGHFVRFNPAATVSPANVSIYSPTASADFAFTGPTTTPLQLYFARKIMALAQANQIKVVFLHFPTFGEIHSSVIHERECWPKILDGNAILMGIQPATMFKGMSDEDIKKLFCGPEHFNRNGQIFFTTLITPSLIAEYDSKTDH
jgi:hypothetical protein